MADIATNLAVITARMHALEKDHQRTSGSVALLAVTKTVSIEGILAAHAAGQNAFGENYVQEAVEKIKALQGYSLTWHFIGAIQSNKTRLIAEYFDWVQSVDRLSIAKRLAVQRPEGLSDLNICLQVNIDEESSKAGANADAILALAEEVSALPHLCLRGLMVLPAKASDFATQLATFQKAFTLYQDLQQRYDTIDTLSMGMTNDYPAAIAAGTTMIRLGTAIFGERTCNR